MAAYANRTDLNSSAMTPEYGGVKKLADAQKAVPMGASPAAAPQQQIQRPVPGAAGSLTRPTERPLEPVTAGANFGPGPNAMSAGIIPTPPAQNDVLEQLAYLNSLYPNRDLENLIDSMTNSGS
jgi:hypothetical protein